jgi:hypothetical protein
MRGDEFDIKNAETKTFAYKIKVNSDSDEKHYQIIAYPSKQVVGMVKYEGKRRKAKVTFEVFDDQTQQWKIGKLIRQSISWWEYKISIEWNGRPLTFVGRHWSHGSFINEHDTVLTEYQRTRTSSKQSSLAFDVYIHSNEIPDPFYLLCIATLSIP